MKDLEPLGGSFLGEWVNGGISQGPEPRLLLILSLGFLTADTMYPDAPHSCCHIFVAMVDCIPSNCEPEQSFPYLFYFLSVILITSTKEISGYKWYLNFISIRPLKTIHCVLPRVHSTGYSTVTFSSASCRTLAVLLPLVRNTWILCHRAASAYQGGIYSCLRQPASVPGKIPSMTSLPAPRQWSTTQEWGSWVPSLTQSSVTADHPLCLLCGTYSLIHIWVLCLLSCLRTDLLSVSLTTANTLCKWEFCHR